MAAAATTTAYVNPLHDCGDSSLSSVQTKTTVRLIPEDDHPHPELTHAEDTDHHHDVHPEASTHEPKEPVKTQKAPIVIVNSAVEAARPTKEGDTKPGQQILPGTTRRHHSTTTTRDNTVKPLTHGKANNGSKKKLGTTKTGTIKENKILGFLNKKEKTSKEKSTITNGTNKRKSWQFWKA